MVFTISSNERKNEEDITKLKAATHSKLPNFGSDVDGFSQQNTPRNSQLSKQECNEYDNYI